MNTDPDGLSGSAFQVGPPLSVSATGGLGIVASWADGFGAGCSGASVSGACGFGAGDCGTEVCGTEVSGTFALGVNHDPVGLGEPKLEVLADVVLAGAAPAGALLAGFGGSLAAASGR